jgi:5-methylthioadenosine/S-adenosylhomocysteine deaminase
MSSTIHAAWVCPVTARPVENGAVVIEHGLIVDVLDPASGGPGRADVSFPNAVLIPGFVNVHTHLELTVLRGFLEDLSFADWIRTLTRTKYDLMDDDDLLVSARLGAAECLRAGVTTIGDVIDNGAGWRAMREAGLSGVAYQEVFGPDRTVAPDQVAGLRAKVDALRSGETPVCRIGVSPHAPYTVSEDLFRTVAAFAREEGLPVAIHVAESVEEVAFVRDGTGAFARNHRERGIEVKARGAGPLEYLDGLGVLDRSTLAIHAIHAGAAAIGMMADRGVAVAHCPKSNLKLGHAVAPVAAFLEAGLRVGLGTDSVASNNSVDMFEEMRTAVYLQRMLAGNPLAMSAATALDMATIGGARCLGLGEQLGSLDAGKRANMAVVSLDGPALTPVYDPVDALVFSATRGDVLGVFVDGVRADMSSGRTEPEARDLARRLQSERRKLD